MSKKQSFKITNDTSYQDIIDFFDSFSVTGITVYGDRFCKHFSKQNPYAAFCINLFRGSVWGVKDGKRQLLKRVFN